MGAGGGSEGRDRAARRSAETIKCRRLQDVGLVGAAAAGMMMPEMIKAAVMKTTIVWRCWRRLRAAMVNSVSANEGTDRGPIWEGQPDPLQ